MSPRLSTTSRRRVRHAWERVGERRRHLVGLIRSVGRPRSVPAELQYRLAHVVDPSGTSSILAVQGLLNASAIGAVHDDTRALAAGSRLYLDLTAASILVGPWLRMLEALVDALEERGVTVRVVGLSPHHPELRRPHDRSRRTL